MIEIEVRTLRVFADETGAAGSRLAVVFDAAKLVPEARERAVLARRLGLPATVFVDELEPARLAIYTPAGEVPTAGHALVGSAWLLGHRLGGHPEILRPPGGDVVSWQEDGRVWIRGGLAGLPGWWHEMLAEPAQVDALTVPRPAAEDLVQVWSWEDEPAGLVRARAFGARHGVAEDQACGSASMRLAAALGRRLTLRHGAGSIVLAQPGPSGFADVGGFVVGDETLVLTDLDEVLAADR